MSFSPNIETVQLCLENYVRLMDDSEKVSDETSFTLCELGLEELVKAWMLYFTYFSTIIKQQSDKEAFFRNYFVKVNMDISDLPPPASFPYQTATSSPTSTIATSEFTEFIAIVKCLYEPDISGAFKQHSVKLDYLGNLLRYFKLLLTLFKNAPNYKPYNLNNFFGKYIKSNEIDQISKKELFDKLMTIIGRFDANQMNLLQKKKEQAIYTEIHGDMLIIPRTRIFNNNDIKTLNEFLYWELIIEINMLIDMIPDVTFAKGATALPNP